MEITKSTALIFGAGSIGERHINNLISLGCLSIIVYRQRNLPLRNVDSQKIKIVTSYDDALRLNPDFGIICSPTSNHLEQTIFCVKNNIPVLVEKPLSHTIEGLADLKTEIKNRGTLLHVGYMMRFHPLLNKVKEGLRQNKWGKLIYIRSYWGEYLPNWHPWEDYRTSYAALKELGGGAALTLSHDLDVVNWLVGSNPLKTNTLHSFESSLEVNVDSAADIQIKYVNGVQSHVHVNYFQKIPRREYQIECEDATLIIDFFANSLTINTINNNSIEIINEFDRNDMFISQSKYFVNLISKKDFTDYSLKQVEESEFIINCCIYE